METSFLRDAIDRIAAMAAPYTTMVGNRVFCSKELHEVAARGELPTVYCVDTLQGLVNLIRSEGADAYPQLFVRVAAADEVYVDSSYILTSDDDHARAHLYKAKSDVPRITTGTSMSQEKAIIELQSLYEVTPDRDYLLSLLSRIDVNQGVSSVDNGVSQEVNVRTGAVLKEQQTVQPIVHLQPYRTFLEIEQPASDFLLRLDKNGCPALYEADGGAWKLDAKRKIAEYLKIQLAELVGSGRVVVMI